MMKTIQTLIVVVIVCLTSMNNVNGQAASAFAEASRSIRGLRWRLNLIENFMKNRPNGIVMSYGVKLVSDGSFVRAITSVVDLSGHLAIGTAIASTAVVDALNNKNTFRGQLNIFGTDYYTVFKPVIDSHGDVTGFVGAGVPV